MLSHCLNCTSFGEILGEVSRVCKLAGWLVVCKSTGWMVLDTDAFPVMPHLPFWILNEKCSWFIDQTETNYFEKKCFLL
jgi:hypothetical protein